MKVNAAPIASAPIRAHRLFNNPSSGVLEIDEISNILRAFSDEAETTLEAELTASTSNWWNWNWFGSGTGSRTNSTNSRSGIRLLQSINARTFSEVNNICPWTPEPNCSIAEVDHTKYRSIDGSCNNLHSPRARNQGKKGTPFIRILPSAYSGINIVLLHTQTVR